MKRIAIYFKLSNLLFFTAMVFFLGLPNLAIADSSSCGVAEEVSMEEMDGTSYTDASDALDKARISCINQYPEPIVVYTGKEDYVVRGVKYTRYRLDVINKDQFPDALFSAAPHLPPCGLNTNSSRTWAQLYDQDDNYLYGFCAFKSHQDLGKIWFAKKRGVKPPTTVKLVLNDRHCIREFVAAPVAIGDLVVGPRAPVIAGIGLVPVSYIHATNGLATTGVAHPLHVKDAPFGSHLRFMGNIKRIRNLGIKRYALAYCDMRLHSCAAKGQVGHNLFHWKNITDSRTNYYWNSSLNKYVLRIDSTNALLGTTLKTYTTPSAALTWYFPNLLFDWRTTSSAKVNSGLYKVHFFGMKGNSFATYLPLPASEATVVVRVDNTRPIMKINSISYKRDLINACSIVSLDSVGDSLQFNVTAYDPDSLLFSYRFHGEYGNNKSMNCAAKTYDNYLAAGGTRPYWSGIAPSATFTCKNFPVSCAYLFKISGKGRAVNGYNRIHYSQFFKTLTIQLP